MTRPILTDRTALLRNRERAESDALFLQGLAHNQIQEKVKEVNRSFTDIAVVTSHPDFWCRHFPDATVVSDDQALDLPQSRFDLVLHV
ncbi:MAG: SAM-dependent methyltransferase, partial [Pseudomonadota bacterium]